MNVQLTTEPDANRVSSAGLADSEQNWIKLPGGQARKNAAGNCRHMLPFHEAKKRREILL